MSSYQISLTVACGFWVRQKKNWTITKSPFQWTVNYVNYVQWIRIIYYKQHQNFMQRHVVEHLSCNNISDMFNESKIWQWKILEWNFWISPHQKSFFRKAKPIISTDIDKMCGYSSKKISLSKKKPNATLSMWTLFLLQLQANRSLQKYNSDKWMKI